MEINGVSFRDYACASANVVAGMPIEKVCAVLGLELPVWEDTKNQWNNKMGEMSMDDMKFYGEVFTNPKQGKFANVAGAADSGNAMEKVPDVETFAKIFEHMAVAEDHGIDSVGILKEYDMNLMKWSKAGSEYSQLLLKSNDDQEMHEKYYMPHHHASEKWKAHFKAFYKDKSAGLSDDIDF